MSPLHSRSAICSYAHSTLFCIVCASGRKRCSWKLPVWQDVSCEATAFWHEISSCDTSAKIVSATFWFVENRQFWLQVSVVPFLFTEALWLIFCQSVLRLLVRSVHREKCHWTYTCCALYNKRLWFQKETPSFKFQPTRLNVRLEKLKF